jgi:creatinine amidohydrolase
MSWNLLETNYATVKQQSYEVAVLPLGATEPHNLHLPYGMDVLEGRTVGEHICRAAFERGAKVVLLPTLPYGTETNLRQFPLAMNVNPSTLYAVITDLIESLVQSGIRKVVLLNSHGGNDLKPLLRELYGKTPAHIFLCNWYQTMADDYDTIFEHPEDHAGEMETSFALAYYPHLVGRRADGSLLADDGRKCGFRLEALRQGWVSITRPWHLLTANSGAAYPHAATAEKGRRMMQLVVERLSSFLVELSQTPIDERFPFQPDSSHPPADR